MVTGSLKKAALSQGMKVEKKYVYGEVNGYLLTAEDVGNNRKLFVSLPIDAQDTRRTAIAEYVEKGKRNFSITAYNITSAYMEIVFYNSLATQKKFSSFLSEFTEKLKELEIPSGAVCSICSTKDERLVKKVKSKDPVLYMHDECCLKLTSAAATRNEEFKNEEKNHLVGAIGALLGGIVGCVPWIVVYMLGYFVGWLGLAIGLAANKGYTMLKGKSSKLKPIIIIAVVIMCVIFATFAAETISMAKVYKEYGVTGYTLGDLFAEVQYQYKYNDEYSAVVFKNIILGIVFAGLGVIQLIKNMFKESKDLKFEVLD